MEARLLPGDTHDGCLSRHFLAQQFEQVQIGGGQVHDPDHRVDDQVREQVFDDEEALASNGRSADGAVMCSFPAREGVVGKDAMQPVLEVIDRIAVALVEHVSAQQIAGVGSAQKCPPKIEAVMSGQDRKKGCLEIALLRNAKGPDLLEQR